MPSFTSILAASALAALTAAKPLPASEGFVINQSQPKSTKMSGPAALAHAYLKYGKQPPTQVMSAMANGQVTATPEPYDTEYLCPVTIGGQTLNLDFDTGSSDLWTFSSLQPTSQSSGHIIYNPSKSSTSSLLSGYTWKISYGDGSGANGLVYTDTVTVGGTTVTKQAVEPAKSCSAQFQQDTANDGLLGLAFSSINTVSPKQQLTFFDNAINQKVISQPLFAVDLKKGKPGSYAFGAIDSTKYTGSITYTSVDNSQGFWGFTPSGYSVGSGSFKTSSSLAGIADTGTTLLLVPQSVVSAYYAQVSGAGYDSSQGGYTFPCSATLPSFTLGVGSGRFTIPGSYMNFAPVSTGSSTCFGGIQSSADIGINIYGDIFLKAVYAVFNKGTLQLGFANKSL